MVVPCVELNALPVPLTAFADEVDVILQEFKHFPTGKYLFWRIAFVNQIKRVGVRTLNANSDAGLIHANFETCFGRINQLI